MTTANKITILRILLVPLFVVQLLYYESTGEEWHRLAAFLCFFVAAVSDGVDGYIARRYNQRSELGALLDPLADKLLLVLGLVILSFDKRGHLPELPLWLVATVFSRDVLLLIGMVVIYYTVGKITVRPCFIGKIATVGQMVSVFWAMLKWNAHWLWWIALLSAVCTGISGILYTLDGVRVLGTSPASGPTPKQ